MRDRGFEEVTEVGQDIEEFGDELPAIEGVQIEYGGDLFSEFELPESEIYGILAAVIILIIAFGSVLAMGLPIGIALFGLGVAFVPRLAVQPRDPDARLHDRRWWR